MWNTCVCANSGTVSANRCPGRGGTGTQPVSVQLSGTGACKSAATDAVHTNPGSEQLDFLSTAAPSGHSVGEGGGVARTSKLSMASTFCRLCYRRLTRNPLFTGQRESTSELWEVRSASPVLATDPQLRASEVSKNAFNATEHIARARGIAVSASHHPPTATLHSGSADGPRQSARKQRNAL